MSIARALAADPRLLIADEITSSLDVSVQGAILNVVREVRATLGLTMLFISHNVAVVRYISDIIAVMYLGQIVEVGAIDEVIADPRHPYTKVLLDSVPGTVLLPSEETRRSRAIPPIPTIRRRDAASTPAVPIGPRVMPERTICATDDPCVDAPRRVNQAACHFAAERARLLRRRVSHALGSPH